MHRRPLSTTQDPGAPPRPALSRTRPTVGREPRPWGEALAVAFVLLAALGLRLPHLLTIPAFSDEIDEVMRGLGILHGDPLPLTNVTTYIGALFNYLVALTFALVGPHVVAPRALVMVAGVLTVAATYLLGRQAGGPLAGLIAAGLMATSGVHIVVNSHIALSSSITPLFVALSVWLVGRGALARDGRALALSGLALGLALQTHPTVIAVLAGCGLALLGRARRLLLTRWGLLAAAAFLAGYANMVVYNLSTGFESLASALGASQDYQRGQEDAPPGYATGLANLGLALLRLLVGGVDRPLRAEALVLDPLALAYALLAGLGLILAARRGLWHWPLVVAIWLLLLPAFNWKYGNLVLSRWISPVAPLCYAGIGLALARAWQRLGTRPAARRWRLVLGLLALALVIQPLWPLQRYYERAARAGPTNEAPLRVAAHLIAKRHAGEKVVIDKDLQHRALENGGTVSKALRYALTLHQVPLARVEVDSDTEGLLELLEREPSVLLATEREHAAELSHLLRLTPLDAPADAPADAPPYGAYRVTRR